MIGTARNTAEDNKFYLHKQLEVLTEKSWSYEFKRTMEYSHDKPLLKS